MNEHEQTHRKGRRSLLMYLILGAGALGSGLSVRAHAIGPECYRGRQAQSGEGAPEYRGYRETAHVREYYAKASL